MLGNLNRGTFQTLFQLFYETHTGYRETHTGYSLTSDVYCNLTIDNFEEKFVNLIRVTRNPLT